uniref:Uncharacterized protein n=1 Tax=Pristionchus pacificus TaxID=54126 RepID=A0A8R1V0X8_PRIPA
MSYALIKQNGVYTITDLTLLIGGAYTRGYTVQERIGRIRGCNLHWNGKRESEMMELKESEEASGKPKGRGRKRGAPKPLKATVPSTSSSAPSYPQHSSFMIRPNSSQGFAQSRHTYPTSHQLDHDTPTTSRSIVNQYSHNPPNYDARVSRNPLP